MHVCVYKLAHVRTLTLFLLCAHLRVSPCVCVLWCGWMCLCESTHALPCEIRLICQWCRSSSMINRPACWKQCYSALSTCGTRCTAGCVLQCTCAMHHEYRAPNLVPDALMLYVCWYISKLCVDTTVCCVQTCMCVLFMSKSVQICDSDRPDKPLRKWHQRFPLVCLSPLASVGSKG